MIKKLFKNPHLILWSLIPVFLTMGILGIDDTIDINIQDTNFMFDFWYCMLWCITLLFSLGVWYWLCKRFKLKLSPGLSMIHVLGTVVSLLVIFYYLEFEPAGNLPRRFSEETYYTEILLGNIILFFISQIALVINSFILLVRRVQMLIKK